VITARGMREPEADLIGEMILQVLHAPEDEGIQQRVREEVRKLTGRFPVYEG